MEKITIENTDKYIASFPKETQTKLKQLRAIIKKSAPKSEESISYQMPTFKYNGPLVYFAGYEKHVGFYPTPSPIKAFEKELNNYKTSKGAIQFPIDEPLPVELITKIVLFKVKENSEKMETKKNLRTCKNGHTYYKTSDCPTCPICENERKPTTGFLSELSAPAIRALESKNIKTLKQLSKHTKKEISELHGMGPSGISRLVKALHADGLDFKK